MADTGRYVHENGRHYQIVKFDGKDVKIDITEEWEKAVLYYD